MLKIKKRRLVSSSKNNLKPVIKFKLKTYYKIFLFCFVIFSILIIFFSAIFKISWIDFERDNLSIDATEVVSELSEYSWKNIFLISLKSIENDLKNKFPKFKDISIKRSFPDNLVLKIYPYEDIFILKTYFTKENSDTKLKEKYLQNFLVSQSWELKNLIDESILEKSTLKIIIVKDDTERKIEWWEIFYDSEMFYKTQLITDKLEQFYWLIVSDIYFYNNAQEIHFQTNMWTMWISLFKDSKKQLDKISIIKSELWDEKIFEYLDLRVFWKIIYK